jgi:hypothetical protein
MSRLSPEKVTLEDLLRLKRAERPAAEFWVQFDRELQAKQLAALVGKKRWWHAPARFTARFFYLPVGATAALTLAMVAAHEYPAPVAVNSHPSGLPMVIKTTPVSTPAAAEPTPVAALPQAPAATAREKPPVAVSETPATNHAIVPAIAPQISTAVTWLADQVQATENTLRTDSAFSATFAGARLDNPVPVSAFPAVGQVRTRLKADPLSQVATPSETQHARMLAMLTDGRPSGGVDPEVMMHQRLSTRVDDERLADDEGRLGASGNSVSFKF